MSQDNDEWLDQSTEQKEKVQEVKPGRGNNRGRGQKKQEPKVQEQQKHDVSDAWVTEEAQKKQEVKAKPDRNRSTRVDDIKPKVEEQVSQIIDGPKEQLQPDPHQSFWDTDTPQNVKPTVQTEKDEQRGNRGRGNRGNRTEQPQQQNNQGRGNRERRPYNGNQGYQNNRNQGYQNRGGDNFNNREGDDRRGGYRGRGRGGFGGNYNNHRDDNRQGRQGQEGQQEGYRGNRNNNYNGNRQFNNNRNRDQRYNNNNQQNQTSAPTVPIVVPVLPKAKQQLVPKGRKAWPQCSIYIMGCKLTITYRQIYQNPCKILVIPYKTIKMQYYPGNLVNNSPVNYKKHIEKKGEAIEKPGSIYIQKAIQIGNFIALAFLKIDQNKLGECFENGLKEILNTIPCYEGDPLDSIVFPISDKLGNVGQIINSIVKSLQAVTDNKKHKVLKEVCISTNQSNCFLDAMSGFQKCMANLMEDNEICID